MFDARTTPFALRTAIERAATEERVAAEGRGLGTTVRELVDAEVVDEQVSAFEGLREDPTDVERDHRDDPELHAAEREGEREPHAELLDERKPHLEVQDPRARPDHVAVIGAAVRERPAEPEELRILAEARAAEEPPRERETAREMVVAPEVEHGGGVVEPPQRVLHRDPGAGPVDGRIEANGAPFIQLHHDPLIGKSINAAKHVWDLVLEKT